MIHEIKIKENYFNRLHEELKTFEVRKNDRDYQVGDILKFTVLYDASYNYSPDRSWEIKYIHQGIGMLEGYVVLAIKEIKP